MIHNFGRPSADDICRPNAVVACIIPKDLRGLIPNTIFLSVANFMVVAVWSVRTP